MPATFDLTYLPSGQVRQLAGSRGDWYEWDDGTRLDLWSTPIYCRRCGDFADGESIETVAEITQQIADLRDPSSELFQLMEGGDASTLGVNSIRFLMGLIQRQEWLTTREAPPKCLDCGTTDVVVLPLDHQIANPTGPGQVVLTVPGHCSTWFNNRFYTPEGDRIARDTQPTY